MSRTATSIIAVVGAGPAGLMAAETLAGAGHNVSVYDRMPSPGRKLLMAGRGGLNLTHSQPFEVFVSRYGTSSSRLLAALEAFPPEALRAWSAGLGQDTFVGTSGRVFPRAMKASPLLRAWLARLVSLGVELRPRHRFVGWGGDGPAFETPEGRIEVAADATILACGGASWPRLGSDGAWTVLLREAGVVVSDLVPANVGFRVAWSELIGERFAGTPLKRVAFGFDGRTVRGEAIVTEAGLEGGAIYPLSGPLRDAIARDGAARLTLDLRPDLDEAALASALSRPRAKQSAATFLRKAARLPPVSIALLRETAPGRLPDDPAALARAIKSVGLDLVATMPIARAISSAGGLAWAELDEAFMLRRRPGVFAAGEMLDWEAPTGGYLLQACFATGRAAGLGAAAWLDRTKADPRQVPCGRSK